MIESSATQTADEPALALSERTLPTPPISFEAFHDWLDEDVHAEWVDGEIILMSPVTLDHQRVLLFLYDLVSRFVRARGLGEVLCAPLLMRLASRLSRAAPTAPRPSATAPSGSSGCPCP